MKSLLAILWLCLLISGCSHKHALPYSVPYSASPDKNLGYLFGNFSMLEQDDDLGVALKVVNTQASKESLEIELAPDKGVALFAVKPGEYRISSVLFPGGKEQLFLSPFLQQYSSFEVKAGTMVYIGDFFGYAVRAYPYYQLGIRKIRNRYDSTKLRLLDLYSAFKSVPTSSIFTRKASPSW